MKASRERAVRAVRLALPALALCAVRASGQDVDPDPPGSAGPAGAVEAEAAGTEAATEAEAGLEFEKEWDFSAVLYAYFVPGDKNYVQPTFTADRDWLHLEARFNYEDLDTGSLWFGYNFSGGDALSWELTPMLGGVFGETDGIAPGYKGSLSWWKLELYSEGEYLVDVGDTSDSFFYNWSELTIAPVDWFRFGLVTQRTRAYDADRDIQRGLLAALSFEMLDVTAAVFNVDTDDPMVVVGLGLSF
jgi:hypothetical protein